MSDAIIRLSVGGVLFEVKKEILLSVKHTYFYGLLSSGTWQPDYDGVYIIDRPAMGFDRILDYLHSGKLTIVGMSESEEECLYSNLDYFLIPYKKLCRYNTKSLIEGFRADYVCEIQDGRLCGANNTNVIIWNLESGECDIRLIGHTDFITQVFQLQDGRVCSCSNDKTIKLWNIESGLCELSLTGHTKLIKCMIQLFDGRLCTGSYFKTARIWNITTGACEMTMITQSYVCSIVQLSDGRICCGDDGGTISIYNLLTGECELSWNTECSAVTSIVCINSTRICSCSDIGRIIKMWNTDTGECVKTLEGCTHIVTCLLLLQDGRLCSASYDGMIKLWNLESGECEMNLARNNDTIGLVGPMFVHQLGQLGQISLNELVIEERLICVQKCIPYSGVSLVWMWSEVK